MVQYYKVYTEIYTRRDGIEGGDSILRILEKAYPGILQATPGPYVELDKATGKYTLKNGVHNEIPFSKKLGLPYILKAINPSFNGFGTDFLKYVSIHEYGHHFTLSTAQDASEGGATLGG